MEHYAANTAAETRVESQTSSHFANPLDFSDQHCPLDLTFLGATQLFAGVDISFFVKVFFLTTRMSNIWSKTILYLMFL